MEKTQINKNSNKWHFEYIANTIAKENNLSAEMSDWKTPSGKLRIEIQFSNKSDNYNPRFTYNSWISAYRDLCTMRALVNLCKNN
jgi:hypothetical protein